MALIFILISLFTIITYQMELLVVQKKYVMHKTGVKDSANNRFESLSKHSIHHSDMSVEEHYLATVDTIETTLVRTCRAINTLSMQNGCANENSTVTTWGFLIPGADNRLINTWNGTTSDTFSCANSGQYGRHLVTSAIPLQYIEDTNLSFNPTDIIDEATRNDPCGYIELITL